MVKKLAFLVSLAVFGYGGYQIGYNSAFDYMDHVVCHEAAPDGSTVQGYSLKPIDPKHHVPGEQKF